MINKFSKVFKAKFFKLKFSDQGIMFFAGSIRGAIAFGLAISIATKNPRHKEVMISSTLALVFFSTIIFGALMPRAIAFFKSFDSRDIRKSREPVQISQNSENEHLPEVDKLASVKLAENVNFKYDFTHPNFHKDEYVSKETNIEVLRDKLSYWLLTYWTEFDKVYMKKKLVHDWPNVLTDQEIFSSRINTLSAELTEESKKKNKEREDMNIKEINDNYSNDGQEDHDRDQHTVPNNDDDNDFKLTTKLMESFKK